MIGKVHFDSGGEPMTATLEDNGYWACPEPFFARALNRDLNCDNYSPADGIRGWLQLHEAANRLDGRVELENDDPGPSVPGRLY